MNEKEYANAMVNTIHNGFASGGNTMATRRKHVQVAKVAAVGIFDPMYLDKLDIVFTK